MQAGWEPKPWGGRGPLVARPSFQVLLGRKAGSGARGRGSAGRSAPAREREVRGAADGRPALQWGRASQEAGNEEVGGGPLADPLPRSARGPAGSRHCERRRGTAHGRDSCTWAAGRHRAGAAGGCAGGGWHRGGSRGAARGLTASLGPRAGWEPVPRVGRGKGGRWSVHGLFPGNFKLAGGPHARGHSARSGRGQLGATRLVVAPILPGESEWKGLAVA